MIIVKKANAEFRIPDEKLDEYLEMGYMQIDQTGKVIQEPREQGEAALLEQISHLEIDNAQLRKDNTVLREMVAEFEKEVAVKADEAESSPPKNRKKEAT